MNHTLTYRASKKKAYILFLVSLVFVIASVLATPDHLLLGLICAAFFSLGIFASLFMMFTDIVFLRLTQEGFDIRYLFGCQQISWNEVDGFRISSFYGTKMIEILFNKNYAHEKVGRRISSAISGMEGAIADSYVASLDEIHASLNEWRSRYATKKT